MGNYRQLQQRRKNKTVHNLSYSEAINLFDHFKTYFRYYDVTFYIIDPKYI